ncbi:MAG: hypothetical protein U0736_25860 [Gemmataceae bacterium]
MRIRLLAVVLLVSVTSVTLSLIRGQERPATASPPAAAPAAPAATTPAPAIGTAATPATPLKPARDFAQMSKLHQQMLYAAHRGADWLFRMHGVKGRFVPGYLPALKQVMEGDNFLRQCGAACALGQSARFIGEERFAARATQTVLALLEETALDPTDSMARRVTIPAGAVNRLGATAALTLAIHELPTPQKDLLDRSDEMCRYIHKQVRADGSLNYHDTADRKADDDGITVYPGLALRALMASHRHRPAAWKTEVVRKAAPYYRAWCREHRNLEMIPDLIAAFTEAYIVTKDSRCAEFVVETSDWLCSLQYTQIDPRRMYWYGGFMSYRDGRPVESAPDVTSARYATALAEACRVARDRGDVTRFQRYSEAIERCLQFLATVQYTDAVCQHFAAWYRPQVVGGFHASHQDGNLRIDYTQHAVAALLGYLEHASQ